MSELTRQPIHQERCGNCGLVMSDHPEATGDYRLDRARWCACHAQYWCSGYCHDVRHTEGPVFTTQEAQDFVARDVASFGPSEVDGPLAYRNADIRLSYAFVMVSEGWYRLEQRPHKGED